MLNRSFLPLAIIAAFIFSCQTPSPVPDPSVEPDPSHEPDTTVVPEPQREHRDFGFTARFEEYVYSPVKSAMAPGGVKVTWQMQDRIGVWAYDGRKALYGPAEESECAALVRYECPGGFFDSDAVFAFTPASEVKSFSVGDALEFSLPSTRTLHALSDFPDAVNPAAATISGDRIVFGNVCSLLNLSVTGKGTVRRIILIANGGERISGDFRLTLDGAGTDSQTLTCKSGGNTVTIDCDGLGVALSEGTSACFKVVVPPGNYAKGFDVHIVRMDGTRMIGTVANNVGQMRRGQIVTAIVSTTWEESTAEVTACTENDAVRDFIDCVYTNPYTTDNFSVSYVDRYYKIQNTLHPYDRLQWGDKPAPASFSWSREPGAVAQRVTVARDGAFSQIEYTTDICATDSVYAAYNLIPGHSYHVKVTSVMKDNSSKVIYANRVDVTGRRRMIAVTSIGNVRDLGGLRTCDGRKQVRYGLIFRGSRLNNNAFVLSTEDKAELLRLGIRADADLRENTLDKLGADIYGKGISPLGEGVDYKVFPKTVNSFFKNLMANDEFIKALQWIIDELKAGKPVYFHCKTGADRTGTLAFLIESLLDICETDKSIDYELTSFFFDFGDPGKYAFRSRSLSLTQAMGTSTTYDWAGMHNVIESLDGADFQQKTYNYFNKGVGQSSATISDSDLNWFISHMLESVPSAR